jgi:hypothetical protein
MPRTVQEGTVLLGHRAENQQSSRDPRPAQSLSNSQRQRRQRIPSFGDSEI